MEILTVMGPATLTNRHHALVLIWALLLLQARNNRIQCSHSTVLLLKQGMIVVTLLFGVFYMLDLQRPNSKEPYYQVKDVSLNVSYKATNNCPEEEMHPLEKNVPLYIITATYPRLEQLAELTRLGQTLKHVKNMRWIVADDASVPTKQVMALLHRLNITHKYILGKDVIRLKRARKFKFACC